MSGNHQKNLKSEFEECADLVKRYVETAQLFGEDYFDCPAASAENLAEAGPAKGEGLQVVTAESVQMKTEKLRALYKKYGHCLNCVLGKSRNKIVFGMGSVQPRVLFVGEGPGREEDKTGLPFVGRAGLLLDKIMKSIGLNRESVYIANIVKCHPMRDPLRPELRGNDRPPEPEEIRACSEILAQQIEILKPSAICALGSPAAKALLHTAEGISRLRGKIYEFKFPSSDREVPLVPTYHPAALLRNELLKKETWEDMKLLRGVLKETKN